MHAMNRNSIVCMYVDVNDRIIGSIKPAMCNFLLSKSRLLFRSLFIHNCNALFIVIVKIITIYIHFNV